MYKSFFFLCFLCMACTGRSQRLLKVGVDPFWLPNNFGLQTSYINGYTEELLLAVAEENGSNFGLYQTNWDSLLAELRRKKYDAVITSLPRYEFNEAMYDFSENILDLGPVLIVTKQNPLNHLEQFKGKTIGAIIQDPAMLILEKHPVLIRSFNSIPELLNAVVTGEITGAILDRIPAVNYVENLYAEQLQIASPPLNDQGLHLVTLKGKGHLVKRFNKGLNALIKKKQVSALQRKWNL